MPTDPIAGFLFTTDDWTRLGRDGQQEIGSLGGHSQGWTRAGEPVVSNDRGQARDDSGAGALGTA